ncbi:MAG: BatD family protein, partial [Opitutaceae bacterium]|nr:BatD family protein [Opitutaceae bacterium]
MTRRTTTLTIFAALFLSALQLFSPSALSQTIRWDPAGGSLAKGQVSQLQLVFENCQPQGNAALPPVPGLELQPNGSRSQNFSNINGRATQTLSFGINARPVTDQRITIPAFKINTDKGEVTVASVSFDVGAATVQGGQLTLDQVVGSKIIAPLSVWAGEVFPLTYRITALKRFLSSLDSENPEWDSLPLNPEPWPKYQVTDELKNGEPWVNVTYNTRAIARAPGDITLNPARQVVVLVTGRDAMFGFPQQEQFAITSDQPKITVKPLPAGAPQNFAGAVGQFKLESKVVPDNAAVGEPITWTLTLSGRGNWPDIQSLPARSVSKDFHAIQPQVKRTPQGENALYEVTLSEDVVLVPTKPGPYTLGPVVWSYFDPAQGRYVTITAPATTVNVAPAANAAAPIFTGTQTASPASAAPALAGAPKQPAGIPGDPLPDAAPAPLPLPHPTLIPCLLACALWPLLLWLVLAFFRARRTDPNRPQREARARIQKTLAQLDETPASEHARVATLLQAWQHDTAILWKIPQVVPSASLFLNTRDSRAGAAWAALWSDSERSLYRSGSPLPPDWSARAHDALAAKRAGGFNPLTLLAPRNLFPLAAALIVSL